jgi:hypothetical protein
MPTIAQQELLDRARGLVGEYLGSGESKEFPKVAVRLPFEKADVEEVNRRYKGERRKKLASLEKKIIEHEFSRSQVEGGKTAPAVIAAYDLLERGKVVPFKDLLRLTDITRKEDYEHSVQFLESVLGAKNLNDLSSEQLRELSDFVEGKKDFLSYTKGFPNIAPSEQDAHWLRERFRRHLTQPGAHYGAEEFTPTTSSAPLPTFKHEGQIPTDFLNLLALEKERPDLKRGIEGLLPSLVYEGYEKPSLQTGAAPLQYSLSHFLSPQGYVDEQKLENYIRDKKIPEAGAQELRNRVHEKGRLLHFGEIEPNPAKRSVEQHALQTLIQGGYKPWTQTYQERNPSTFTPEKLQQILDRKDWVGHESPEEAVTYLNALQQARQEAAKRGEGFQGLPPVVAERIQDPNEYYGKRITDLDPRLAEAWKQSGDLRDTAIQHLADVKERAQNPQGWKSQLEKMPPLSEKTKAAQDRLEEVLKKMNTGELPADTLGSLRSEGDKFADEEFNIYKRYADEKFEKQKNSLHGKFASHHALDSSAYQQAMRDAVNDHERRLEERKFALKKEGREWAISMLDNQRKHWESQMSHLYQQVPHNMNQINTVAALTKADREKLLEEEKIKRDIEQMEREQKAAHVQSLEGTGTAVMNRQAAELAAQRAAHEERRGGNQDLQRKTNILAQLEHGSSPVAVPSPPTFQGTTAPSMQAANAALVTGIGNVLPHMMAGQPQPRQGNPYAPIQQNQQQQMPGFATGGHVPSRDARDHHMSQLHAYEKAKERFAEQALPIQNPWLAGLGDMSAALAQSVSPQSSVSPMGAWGMGMKALNGRLDEAAKAPYAHSKNQLDAQKTLANLYKDAAKLEQDEDLDIQKLAQLKELEQMKAIREQLHHQERMGLYNAKREESQRKAESPTFQDIKTLDELEKTADQLSNLMGESDLLSEVSRYVPGGPLVGKVNNSLRGFGANPISPSKGTNLLNWYERKTGEYANQLVGMANNSVVRNVFGARMIVENKPGLQNTEDVNESLSREKGGVFKDALEYVYTQQLRLGASKKDVLERIQSKANSVIERKEQEARDFAKIKGFDEKKTEWLVDKVIKEQNEKFHSLINYVDKLDVDFYKKQKKEAYDAAQPISEENDILIGTGE